MGEDPLTHGSMFYREYPAFPEIIPCLSSSSSSSFSSAACWDLLKSDTEEDHVVNDTNVDCMDVMETFEGMDLMEGGSDMWDDHDAIFSDYQNSSDFQHNHQQVVPVQQQQSTVESQGESSKDLAQVFLEWLKSNKESISAEDLRKIKLKKSTIESAIQRFGGGKEGMKKLLKLILEWVQNHHLQRMRMPENPSHLQAPPNPTYHPNFTDRNCSDFTVRSPSDQNPCFSIANWNVPQLTIPQQFSPHGGGSAAMAMGTGFSTMVGYSSESMLDFTNPYQHTSDYSCSASQYAMPSPTKEARRTRMARQKRVLPHHKHNKSSWTPPANRPT